MKGGQNRSFGLNVAADRLAIDAFVNLDPTIPATAKIEMDEAEIEEIVDDEAEAEVEIEA